LNKNKIGGFLKKKNNQKLRKVIPYYAPQDMPLKIKLKRSSILIPRLKKKTSARIRFGKSICKFIIRKE
jgi:hypothetical protein